MFISLQSKVGYNADVGKLSLLILEVFFHTHTHTHIVITDMGMAEILSPVINIRPS